MNLAYSYMATSIHFSNFTESYETLANTSMQMSINAFGIKFSGFRVTH